MMKSSIGIASFAAVILVSFQATAQAPMENTAPVCQDGIDNDGDGFADCGDQDCQLFTFCTSPEVSTRDATDHWALAGAVVGFTSGAIVLGLSIGAEATNGDPIAPNVIGGSAIVLGIALTPVSAAGAKSARRAANVRGCLGCRIAGWIAYGLSIADGLTLIGLGVGAGIIPPTGLITSVGVLGALASWLMAIDSLKARKQAAESVVARPGSTERRFSMVPYIAPVGDERGFSGGVLGLSIVHL